MGAKHSPPHTHTQTYTHRHTYTDTHTHTQTHTHTYTHKHTQTHTHTHRHTPIHTHTRTDTHTQSLTRRRECNQILPLPHMHDRRGKHVHKEAQSYRCINNQQKKRIDMYMYSLKKKTRANGVRMYAFSRLNTNACMQTRAPTKASMFSVHTDAHRW